MSSPGAPEFRDADRGVSLRRGTIDLWAVTLAATPSTLERFHNLLCPVERERARQFRFPRDRDAFVVAHGALRLLLGSYLNRPPQSLRFSTGASGKPALAGDLPTVVFNLSHTEHLALFGFALRGDIGVDVESIRPVPDALSIAERYFAPSERAALAATPARLRDEYFLRCWTRKEAFVKASGDGISRRLDGFSVLPLGVPVVRGRSEDADRDGWWICQLQPDHGYVAAVSSPDHPQRMRAWKTTGDALIAILGMLDD